MAVAVNSIQQTVCTRIVDQLMICCILATLC